MERNYGIDLLKVVAMFFIVLIHLIGHGGVLVNSTGLNNVIVWAIEIIGLCGVNCYALVSGYLGYKDVPTSWNLKRYFELWLQTVFVGLSVMVIVKVVCGQGIDLGIIKALFPITFNQYWYFTAYTGVFIIMPFLNDAARRIDANKFLIILICFSCYVCVANRWFDSFKLNRGYSFVWLAILYVCGAVIKKEKINQKIKVQYSITIVLLMWVIALLVKCFIGVKIGHGVDTFLVQYTSPTMLLMSINLLLIFSKMSFSSSVIKRLGNSTYSIYIFHDNVAFRESVIYNKLGFIGNMEPYFIPLYLFAYAALIFIIGVMVNQVWVFGKKYLIHIN